MEVKDLIKELLDNRNVAKRRESAEELINLNQYDSEIIEALSKGLLDPDSGIRDLCSQTLINAPEGFTTEAAQAVVSFIDHVNIETRNLAGDILIKLKSASVPALLPYLKDKDFDTRKFACDILGLVGDGTILDEVLALLEDNDMNVVASSIESAGNIACELALDRLFSVYEKYEDLQVNIIESIGKIGGEKAQNFLIDQLKNESDMFLQVACIDALAYSGQDMSLCYNLLEELENTKEELQTVLLKTIFAISFRLKEEVQLPIHYRPIAHRALQDEDEDIRAAGLVALGNEYFEEDVEILISEVNKENIDIQQHILFNLMLNSKTEIVEIFFLDYFAQTSADGSDLEFIGMLSIVWQNIPDSNKNTFMNGMLDVALSGTKGNAAQILEFALRLENDEVTETLKHTLESGDNSAIREALDIISQLELTDFGKEISNLQQRQDDIGEIARNIS